MITSIATREELTAEAVTWERTPYHRNAKVKGVGCDCATLIFCPFRACGIVPDEQIGVFADDWAANAKEEIYMLRILRHAYKVAEGISYRTFNPEPGNIVLTKTSESLHAYDHGGIVIKWPMVLHSAPCAPGYVTQVDATKHFLWCFKKIYVFDPWEKVRRGAI